MTKIGLALTGAITLGFLTAPLLLPAQSTASPGPGAGRPSPVLLDDMPRPGLGATNSPPLSEVYDLVRAHLSGVGEDELNQTAVQALISALSPKVSIVSSGAPTAGSLSGELVSKSTILNDDIVYVRIARVDDGLARAVREAFDQLASTNKMQGVVLDLRFADGDDYAAAAAVADLFVKKEKPLLDWGNGVVKSKEKSDAVTLPVAVLINHQTAAAAEALAGTLRETGAGLLLGARTAGQAMITRNFPLKDGRQLRIATAPVKLGDGAALSGQGVKPDISVEVSVQDEKAYYRDPFTELKRGNIAARSNLAAANSLDATNHTARRARFNEAELVRERKEGNNPEAEAPTEPEVGPEPPRVQDPVLARALDVLKGLALVRQARS